MLLGQLPPRPQKIEPRRMQLPSGFSDEWKKIGSKRSKFQDLRRPRPTEKSPNKIRYIFVEEI